MLQGNSPVVDLKVMLPNKKVVTVKVKRNSSSCEVYRMVATAVGITQQNLDFFSIYEIVEHNFGKFFISF